MSGHRGRRAVSSLCALALSGFVVTAAADRAFAAGEWRSAGSGVRTDGTAPGGGGGDPQLGGSFTFTHTLEPRSLDPVAGSVASDGGDAPHFYALYGALVMEDPATTEVVAGLAESLTTEDGLVWTLRLRPDVVFSDGTPFDAEAVKFNTERHAVNRPGLVGGS